MAGGVGALGVPSVADAARGRSSTAPLPPGWTYPVIPELLPFGHGVMSGISWVDVRWVVSRDVQLRDVVARGSAARRSPPR